MIMRLNPLHMLNYHNFSMLPAIFSTTGRIHGEFLRLLFLHAHQESEECLRLRTGGRALVRAEQRGHCGPG